MQHNRKPINGTLFQIINFLRNKIYVWSTWRRNSKRIEFTLTCTRNVRCQLFIGPILFRLHNVTLHCVPKINRRYLGSVERAARPCRRHVHTNKWPKKKLSLTWMSLTDALRCEEEVASVLHVKRHMTVYISICQWCFWHSEPCFKHYTKVCTSDLSYCGKETDAQSWIYFYNLGPRCCQVGQSDCAD